MLTGSDDGTARLWRIDGDHECIAIIRGHRGAVISAEFSPDGERFLTSSTDGTARVWPVRVKELKRLAELRCHRELSPEERETYQKLLGD